MANYSEAFEAALTSLGYSEAPERRLSRAEVSELARQIAAAEGIKYKSARRRLERHRTTTGREFRGQPNRRFADQLRRRGLRVYAELEIDASPKRKRDMRPRQIDIPIPGDKLDKMAAALERGDLEAAESEFYETLLMEYMGMPDAIIGEVSVLSIQWLDLTETDYSDLPF